MEAQPHCCARLQTQLTIDRVELTSLAKKAARLDARNRDITALKALIVKQKALIEVDKQKVRDHEADHAADDAGLSCTDAVCTNPNHYERRA